MDRSEFLQTCNQVVGKERENKGIGTLMEKTLHATLKKYLEPNPDNREVPVKPYVADIKNDRGIIEIQTRGFDRLRGKLQLFLQTTPVTVVYPVAQVKWIIWVEEDGAAEPRKKSPKKANACEILPELYKIKGLLTEENLTFCVPLLEVEEYRIKDGWANGGKRGATLYERIPVDLLGEVYAGGKYGYSPFLPDNLPKEFTVKDFSKCSKLSQRKAAVAVNVLNHVGAVEKIGKSGRAFLYRCRNGEV